MGVLASPRHAQHRNQTFLQTRKRLRKTLNTLAVLNYFLNLGRFFKIPQVIIISLLQINSIVKMTGDTAVEVPVVDDNKVEDVVKTDKEVIAEEEKELIENEKTDEPEKTEEGKEEEEKTEPKKVHLLQKLFGKRKDFVVPKIDEVAKTDKEIINEEEKTEEKPEEEKEEKEEKEKVQHKFKKLFSMKKAKKEEKEEEKVEEKVEEGEEKKDEEKKEGEEVIEEASEVDVSTTTAEKKTLMQK